MCTSESENVMVFFFFFFFCVPSVVYQCLLMVVSDVVTRALQRLQHLQVLSLTILQCDEFLRVFLCAL